MHVLGIDQSIKATGLALRDGDVTRTHVIHSEPGVGSWGMREAIRYVVGQTLRFAPYSLDLTVIEAPIIPRHGGGLALERAWLFGFLFDQLIVRGPVATVHPSTRALYATGNGKADKADVVAAMKVAHPDVATDDHNVADGLALMGMGARWLGEPVDGELTKKQLGAMRTAHWPVIERKQ
jgi:hypothetical protein